MTRTVSLFRPSSVKPSLTVSSSRAASTAACTPSVVRIGIDSSTRDCPRWIRSARRAARLQRHFFSGASEAELDKQGRVMIPAQLIEHAKLGTRSRRRGCQRPARDLGPRRLAQELAEVEGSAEDVAERLADKRD